MTERGAMEGMGAVLMIGESLPLLVLFAITLRWRFLDTTPVSSKTLLLFVGLMTLLIFVVTGLRGSRSNFIHGLIVLGVVVDVLWRPVSKTLILTVLPVLFIFGTIYGLYKDIRKDIFEIRSVSEYHERTEYRRNWKMTILGDLGRADIQAILCAHACSGVAKLRFGSTYAHAFSLLVPRGLRPEFDSKAIAGTYALYGYHITARSTQVGQIEGQASQVYGWTGETILNFGVLAAPFAFVVFGLWQNTIRAILGIFRAPDVRMFFYPLCLQFAVHVAGDMDNLVFGVVKTAAFPVAFLFLVSRVTKVRDGNPCA